MLVVPAAATAIDVHTKQKRRIASRFVPCVGRTLFAFGTFWKCGVRNAVCVCGCGGGRCVGTRMKGDEGGGTGGTRGRRGRRSRGTSAR